MKDDKQQRIFTKNLIKQIEDRDLTQVEVAEAIGVSQQTFNTWCRGLAIPRMGKIQALADYFGIPKSKLVDEQPVEIADAIEVQLLAIMKQLNNEGKERILEYANFINAQGLYKKCNYSESVG